jgi:hypothetical protein
MASEFYKELYKQEGVQGMDAVLDMVPIKVTLMMNEMLDMPFDINKVKATLSKMYPKKAPCFDGFLTHFLEYLVDMW